MLCHGRQGLSSHRVMDEWILQVGRAGQRSPPGRGISRRKRMGDTGKTEGTKAATGNSPTCCENVVGGSAAETDQGSQNAGGFMSHTKASVP